jgi:imidazole glycerol phosphate synthase subunit HisF
MRDALLTGVDAALAAGIFHRGEVSIAEVKRVCAVAGLPVREVRA